MVRSNPEDWLSGAARLFKATTGRRIVEIGSVRLPIDTAESLSEGQSTVLWARIANELWTVDVEPRATAVARTLGRTRDNIHAITQDGCEFLKSFHLPIDLLYLDAWDVWTPEYKRRHAEAYCIAKKNLHDHSLILIDDTDIDFGGKGSLVIAAAEEDGFRIRMWGRQTLLARVDPLSLGIDLSVIGPPLPNLTNFPQAIQLHQRGLVWEAENVYRKILTREPQHHGAWHLLGVALHQRGEHRQAVSSIENAIELDGSKATYHNNLGAALRGLGQTMAANVAFERALAIRPRYADAIANCGLISWDIGQHDRAETHFREAIRHQPHHVDATLHLSKMLSELRRYREAFEVVAQALTFAPNRPEFHLQRAGLLRVANRLEDGIRSYQEVLNVQPTRTEAHVGLGLIYTEQERAEEAEQQFRKASQLRPDKPLWKSRWMGICPAIFQSNSEIDKFRDRLMSGLESLAHAVPSMPMNDVLGDAIVPSFYLAHQGRDNRPIKESFARIYEQLIPVDPLTPRTEKPKLGFVVTHGHEGGFLRGMGGILERLSPKLFDIVVFASHSGLAAIRNRLARETLDVIGLPERLSSAIETIRTAECDVIDHWQIGTDSLNYLLPFASLAPMQSTGWGTHGTSGIKNINYYLSSQLMEAPNADEHYTEQLVRFQTFPIWQERIESPSPVNRAYFGLPSSTHLYLCPHRLAKIHPDMDAIFAAILRNDSSGLLILKQGKHGYATAKLRERFNRTLPDVMERILIYPEQTLADFHRLVTIADVVLDPIHYSAGLMAYDCFSFNVPLVTLPGKYLVSRYTAGYYSRMQVPQLVADSIEDYVAIALKVAGDDQYRHFIRGLLADRTGLLFRDVQAVQLYEHFFERAVAESRRSGLH